MIEIMFSREYMRPSANFHAISQTADCKLALLAAHDRLSATVQQSKPKRFQQRHHCYLPSCQKQKVNPIASGESPLPLPHFLGLQVAHNRSYLCTVGPKVGIVYILGALGIVSGR